MKFVNFWIEREGDNISDNRISDFEVHYRQTFPLPSIIGIDRVAIERAQ